MIDTGTAPALHPDDHRRLGRARFLEEVWEGLSRVPKSLSPKWLYDEAGSELYERITGLPEYYPTRTELAILEAHAGEIAEAIGPHALVLEPGVGSGRKTALLLEALDRPAAWVPVDIAAEALAGAAARMSARFPGLPVRPVVADFTGPVVLPTAGLAPRRKVAFFPGSTIGNLDPGDAIAFLRTLAVDAGEGGALLVGVDLPKEERTLLLAYDDPAGVTAAFDLNLLARMNRELDAGFRLSRFRHLARFDRRRSRIEMHLESLEAQVVPVAGRRFRFRAGETIHTESSYKWSPAVFDGMAAAAGWRPERAWADGRGWFSLRLYERW
jgi:dimethylhistidine N-methyltransferase